MKTKKRSILVLMLSLFMVGALSTSCKKDDVEDKEEDQPIEKFFKLKIDNNAEITYTNVRGDKLGGMLTISGTNGGSENIQLQFVDDISTGTTTSFTPSRYANGGFVFNIMNVTSKTMDITIHDTTAKHIAGTYTIHYTDDNNGTHTATGSFEATY